MAWHDRACCGRQARLETYPGQGGREGAGVPQAEPAGRHPASGRTASSRLPSSGMGSHRVRRPEVSHGVASGMPSCGKPSWPAVSQVGRASTVILSAVVSSRSTTSPAGANEILRAINTILRTFSPHQVQRVHEHRCQVIQHPSTASGTGCSQACPQKLWVTNDSHRGQGYGSACTRTAGVSWRQVCGHGPRAHHRRGQKSVVPAAPSTLPASYRPSLSPLRRTVRLGSHLPGFVHVYLNNQGKGETAGV